MKVRSGRSCLAETLFHHFLNGVENVFVARAAAEMTGEQLPKLIARILLARLKDLDRGHDKAGRTEAALHRGLVDERLLNVGQFAVRSEQTFERADILPSAQIAR